jgi:hypothetical protein
MTLLLNSPIALAGPKSISYEGFITDASDVPINGTPLTMRFKITDPSGACIVYQETRTNVIPNQGHFTVPIGQSGAGMTVDFVAAQASADFAALFSNAGSLTTLSGCGGTYGPSANDNRVVVVDLYDGSYSTIATIPLSGAAFALNSDRLGGVDSSNYLKFNKVTALRTAAEYDELVALLTGASTQYVKPNSATSFTAAVSFSSAPQYGGSVSSATDLTNKSYVDGQISFAMSTGVFTEAQLPTLTTAGKVNGGAINSGTIGGSAGVNTSGNLVTTGTVSGGTVSSTNLKVFNGGNYIQINAPALSGNVNLVLPPNGGSPNQVLQTNGSGTLSWATPAASVTNVTGVSPILSSGGTTPVISINQASAVTDGYLSQADWNTFIGKFSSAGGTLSGSVNMSNNNITNIHGTSYKDSGSNTVTVQAPPAVGASYNLTLPNNSGTNGYVLTTDGTGVTSWVAANSVVGASDINSGVLGTAYGGTGVTSFSPNQMVYANGAGTALQSLPCSLGQVLAFGATGDVSCENVNNASQLLRLDSSANALLPGNLGIGTATPGSLIDAKTTGAASAIISLTSDAAAGINVTRNSGNPNPPTLNFSKARGTAATMVPVNSGDIAGSVSFNAYDGVATDKLGEIKMMVDGAPSVNNMPGKMVFSTAPAGTSVPVTRMIIDNSGRVGIGATPPSALLNLPAGTTAAGTAPLKLTAGTNLVTPESGSMEYDGSNLYFTPSAARRTIAFSDQVSTLTGPGPVSITAGSNQNLTLSAPGTGIVTTSSNMTITSGTASGSSSTGALVVTGGLGVSGAINSGSAVTAASYLMSPLIYGSSSASGNLTLDSTSNATKGFVVIAPTSGNVGIGTSSPTSKLQVEGPTLFHDTNTATSGSVTSANFQQDVVPSAVSSGTYTGFGSSTYYSGSQNITGGLTASSGQVNISGSGAVISANGVNGLVSYFSPGVTLTNSSGVIGGVVNSSTGTISSAAGFTGFLQNLSSGTITNGYGAFLKAPTNPGGGSISNFYGLYVQQPTVATNNYAIYSVGGTNYFGGNVGIGTTLPTSNLSFSGNSAISIGMEREAIANTAGNNLTLKAGAATSGSTDKNGGNLILSAGTATGTGTSSIQFQTALAGGGTGTTDKIPTTAMVIDSAGRVGIGTSAPTSLLEVNGPVNLIGGAHFSNSVGANGLLNAFMDGVPCTSSLSLTIAGGGTSSTSIQNCIYTLVGKKVDVAMDFTFTVSGTVTGTNYTLNLPFPVGSGASYPSSIICKGSGLSAGTFVNKEIRIIVPAGSSSSTNFQILSGSAWAAMAPATTGVSQDLKVNCTYWE